MKQVYVPYWKWECYKNGMWNKLDKETEQIKLKEAIEFTGDYLKYGKAMKEVIFVWKNSMVNFLTNKSINKLAYIGHCAVHYKLLIPEYIVRMAWKELTETQQKLANLEAFKALKLWEQKQNEKLLNMSNNGKKDVILEGYQMKLLFP